MRHKPDLKIVLTHIDIRIKQIEDKLKMYKGHPSNKACLLGMIYGLQDAAIYVLTSSILKYDPLAYINRSENNLLED